MARTNATAVKLVLSPGGDYSLTRTPDLTPFIETASAMVDDVVECAAEKGKPLDTTRAELIERWLAAHYFQQSDQGYSSRSTDNASGQFQGQTKMYLESTKYGQTAVRLDKSGCLAAVAGEEPKVAGGFWAGKTETEMIDYDNRQ